MLMLSGMTRPLHAHLGAVEPDLSVKEYVVSGVRVWASYQSPEADKVLRSIKANMNKLGAGVSTDGLIGPVAAERLVKIADKYKPASGFPYAGTPEAAAMDLLALAKGGSSVIAKRGIAVERLIKVLADKYGSSIATVPATPSTPTTTPSTPSYPTTAPVEDLFPSSGELPDTTIKPLPKWPYVIGGLAVAGGLAFIVWALMTPKKSKDTIYRDSSAW